MGRYRDRLQIIADILSVVRSGAKKTHVMYQANLSYALLSRYLTEVIEAGLIRVDKDDCYSLTRSGESFLDRFNEYSKRCEDLEQQFNNVNDEKTVLEHMIDSNRNRRLSEHARAQAKQNKRVT